VVDNTGGGHSYDGIFNQLSSAQATANLVSRGFSVTGSIGQGTSPYCTFVVGYAA